MSIDTSERDRRWVSIISKLEPKDLHEAAALLGTSEEAASEFLMRFRDVIEAAKVRQRVSGAGRARLAGRVVDQGLQRIAGELESGNVDVMEIPTLLKPALNILDAEARRQARLDEAAKGAGEELGMIIADGTHITILTPDEVRARKKQEVLDDASRAIEQAAEGDL